MQLQFLLVGKQLIQNQVLALRLQRRLTNQNGVSFNLKFSKRLSGRTKLESRLFSVRVRGDFSSAHWDLGRKVLAPHPLVPPASHSPTRLFPLDVIGDK